MGGALAGRDAVLDQGWAALLGAGTVLIEGPAGIGKTAVFRTLTERAAAAGMVVLRCAPTEAETALPLAAIADLLQPLADQIGQLPAPQRDAVRTALLSAGPSAALDERALAAATRALIDEAGSVEPGVLVAIDDPVWLDPPSQRALRFALRRVSSHIAVVITSRVPGAVLDEVPLGLGGPSRIADGRTITRIPLSPLGVGPLYHVLAARFDVPLTRSLVNRVTQAAAGNPLLAIELVRAVLRLPEMPGPGDDLPVPGSMVDLVAATLGGLPQPSVHAVQLAALSTVPSLDQLIAVGVDPAALDAAELAGLIRVMSDDHVVFVHATHAAAVRAGIPANLRRRLHAMLAAAAADPDERARHLARSTSRPDADVAAELAAAARRARRHGAPEVAAELYDRAAELTPSQLSEQRHHRKLDAVHCRFDTGDYAAAGAEAERLVDVLTGDQKADALLVRAAIAWSADDPLDAVQAASRALDAAPPDSPLLGRIHAYLGVFVDSPIQARAHAELALRLLSGPRSETKANGLDDADRHDGILGQDDQSLLASALMLLFYNEVRSGEPIREELLTQAMKLEGSQPLWLNGTIPAIWWKACDQHDRAVQRLTWMLDYATELGDEPFQHELVSHLGEAEMLAGRYDAAMQWSTQASEFAEQLATGLAAENWLAGMLHLYRCDVEAASRAAQAGLQQATDNGDPWCRRVNLQLSGLAELASNRFDRAAVSFGELARALDDIGLTEPLAYRFEPDWVEACVASGDLQTAATAQERLMIRHERFARPWTALGLARGAVLLAAANGRPTEDTLAELAAAREAVPDGVVPLDRARCLLVAGVAHRRGRRKRAAREDLSAAAAEFDALGARSFATRARAESARIGGRPPASRELTSTERQVAELAARGATNRAIADALFVSPKTVEANLARVYRKLGISSRAELGAVFSFRKIGDT